MFAQSTSVQQLLTTAWGREAALVGVGKKERTAGKKGKRTNKETTTKKETSNKTKWYLSLPLGIYLLAQPGSSSNGKPKTRSIFAGPWNARVRCAAEVRLP